MPGPVARIVGENPAQVKCRAGVLQDAIIPRLLTGSPMPGAILKANALGPFPASVIRAVVLYRTFGCHGHCFMWSAPLLWL